MSEVLTVRKVSQCLAFKKILVFSEFLYFLTFTCPHLNTIVRFNYRVCDSSPNNLNALTTQTVSIQRAIGYLLKILILNSYNGMKCVVKLAQMKKPRNFQILAETKLQGSNSSTTKRGLIRLASVNHSTGTGGFLKCKKHGNRKKLHTATARPV